MARQRRERSDKGMKRGPRVPDKLTRAVETKTPPPLVVPDMSDDTTERGGMPVVVAPEHNSSLIWRACQCLDISPDDIKKYEATGDKITVVTHERAHTLSRGDL